MNGRQGNRRSRQRRGQPLVALGLILGAWVAVRVAVWEAPRAAPAPQDVRAEAGTPGSRPASLRDHGAPEKPEQAAREAPSQAGGGAGTSGWMLRAPVPVAQPEAPMQASLLPAAPPRPPAFAPVPVGTAAGHQLLWMAATSRLPLPAGVAEASLAAQRAALLVPDRTRAAMPASAPASARRWSVEGWVLLRRGGGLAAGGLAAPALGASQAGAVLRYRLAPGSGHRPALYLRGSAALNGSAEREAAAGLALRPVPGLPVAVMAEARATRMAGRTHLRPAIAAVTELPPWRLPLGARAEAYAQAGYVGGAGATAFIDGQLRIQRPLGAVAGMELAAGGGVWGGAQAGASRLDAGPAATLDLRIGPGQARVAVDWRFRVAGNAAPTSGPALTLSAGF